MLVCGANAELYPATYSDRYGAYVYLYDGYGGIYFCGYNPKPNISKTTGKRSPKKIKFFTSILDLQFENPE
jgi:hypothetical protein